MSCPVLCYAEKKSKAPYRNLKNRKRTSKCQVLSSTVPENEEKFSEFFLKSPVSRMVPKNVKGERPFGILLNIHSVAKYKKLKGSPSEKFKNLRKKVSQSRNNMQKILVKGETRTHVLLLGRPQKS